MNKESKQNDELSRDETAATDSLTAEEPKPEETIEQAAQRLRSANYLNDDEELLAGDDQPIKDDELIALFSQEEGVVAWELTNFQDENGDLKSKRQLRESPPMLTVKSSSGDFVEFALTKGFNKSLLEALKSVDRAYFGVDSRKKKFSFADAAETAKLWFTNHPIRAILTVAAVALFVVLIVVF